MAPDVLKSTAPEPLATLTKWSVMKVALPTAETLGSGLKRVPLTTISPGEEFVTKNCGAIGGRRRSARGAGRPLTHPARRFRTPATAPGLLSTAAGRLDRRPSAAPLLAAAGTRCGRTPSVAAA